MNALTEMKGETKMLSMWLVACLCVAVLSLCAFAAEGKFVCNFESPEVAARFKVTGARAEWTKNTEDGAEIEGVAFAKEVEQSGALHLVLEPGKTFTTVEYSSIDGMPSDWSGHETFSMSFENGSEFMINLHLTLTDGAGAQFVADNLWIFRSKNRIDVPVSEIRAADGRPLDMSRITNMKLEIRSAEKFERDIWLFQIHLRAAEKPVVAPRRERMLLDFGPLGAPVIPGAKLVTEKTAYAPWRGYGWTTGAGALEATYFKRPDALVSDWVWADLAGAAAKLRVDLPDGKYRARLYGGNYNTKAVATRSFELMVNGKTVAKKAADPKTYYTKTGHFLGIDQWYEAGEDPYDKFISPFYQTYDFEFTVGGGAVEFAWTKTLAVWGLLIAPADGVQFADAAASVEGFRRQSLEANLVFPRPPKKAPRATPAEAKRGFLLWSRGWSGDVGVYDLPKKKEKNPRHLDIVAARDQRQHVTLTATPLRPLGKVKLDVSALKGPGGATLPKSAVEVRAVRYMWLGWPAEVGTGCLYPTREVPSKDTVNVTFWITVTPDAKAKPGLYRGKATISAKKGGKAVVPLTVEVRPFALTRDHNVSFALWRCTNYNMNYCMRYFMPQRMDYFRKILDAEFADMKAHGLSSYYFNPPIIRGVDGPRVKLDFTCLEEECRAAKKWGFASAKNPGMVFLLPDIARYLMKETRYGDFMEPEDLSAPLPESEQLEEFSDLFVARYVDAARQIQAFFEKQGLSVLLYPSDEPRERNTNRWNRNLEDTIRYCRIIRENVPGTRIYVDPMRDSNSGVDYISICDNVDAIGTHPWDQSGRIVEKCRRDGKPELWYFNMIAWDRYDFGLQQAASGARGCWQWHYQWDLVPFQPFHSGFKWGITVPGPNGPLDKPQYEMIAEGVTDFRYFATLENTIAEAKKSGRAAKAVARAEKAIAAFLKDAPPYAVRADYERRSRSERKKRDRISGKSLDTWREVFAAHIEAIREAM